MARQERTGRQAPWWVREMSSQALHRLGGRLYNRLRTDGLSPKEDWLLDTVINELGWRHTRTRIVADRCTCQFCMSPFPA